MTKNDYEVLADEFNKLLAGFEDERNRAITLIIIERLCSRFKLCNPRFSAEKFKEACGVND